MSDLLDELDPSLALSTEALSALTEFLAEQKQQDDAFTNLQRAAYSAADMADSENEEEVEKPPLSMKVFQEDWQLSQFWYDEETAKAMGDELVTQAKGGLIVCVSAPTVFLYLKNKGVPNPLVLLEIDQRFLVFPQFKMYDYNHPLDVDGLEEGGALLGAAAAVILDPPFLNEDCFSKSAETVQAMSNKDTSILISTGWTIRKVVEKTLSAHMVAFRPRHNQLTNAFRCYTNYTSTNPEFALDADPENGCNDFDSDA